jgi:hypothetical protein
MSGPGFIAEDHFYEVCELCGEVAELRPYGPNGEEICFQCGMKDEEATKRQSAECESW